MDQDPSASESTADKTSTEILESDRKEDGSVTKDLNEEASDTLSKKCVESERLTIDEPDRSSQDECSKIHEIEADKEVLLAEADNKSDNEPDDKPASDEKDTVDRLSPTVTLLAESTSESPKCHSEQSKEVIEEAELAENPLDIEDEEHSEKSLEVVEESHIDTEKSTTEGKPEEESSESCEENISESTDQDKTLESSSKTTDESKTVEISETSLKISDKEKTSVNSSKAIEKDKTPERSPKITEENKNSESKKTTDEILLVDSDKEDDKQSETEKTEFVQITHDKQDESPIEGQSIEAEDPFGGDTPADSVEQMDTEEFNERNRNFSQLGDEADNLQDVVKATTSSEAEKEDEVESKLPPMKEKQREEKEKDKEDSSGESEKKSPEGEEVIEEIIEIPASSSKDSERAKSKDKDSDIEVIPVEEQSTVLPGQDDELCIIPDDMKIILPIRPKPLSKISAISQKDDAPPETPEAAEKGAETATKSPEAEKEPAVVLEEKTTEEIAKGTEPPKEITDNVIDIDEESKNSAEIEEITHAEKCKQCGEEKACKIRVKSGNDSFSVCSKRCQNSFMETHGKATDIPSEGANSKYEKRCASCLLIVENYDDRNLQWETMEFCNEECLGKFQTKYGSYCRNCNGNVQAISLGKYCVRFGYDVRQFCCSTCLEEFKKGLKVCSYCQKDISSGTDGFLAPVGDKGQFKDFCTQQCMEKYSRMNSSEPPPPERKACSVCQEEKIVFCEVQIDRGQAQAICSEPCFAAFKFVNKVDPDQCSTCKKYFQVANKKSTVVFYNKEAHTFCNKSCLNIFIITNRKIVPCNWCKVKKYNFDMIKKELKSGQVVMMCSLNCLTLYQVSINAVSAKRIKCDLCKEFSQAQYHLTMSDATIRNFCSYNCVMKFQAQYTKSPITIPAGDDVPVPTGMPKRTYPGKVIQGVVKKGTDIQSITNLQTISSLQNMQSKKTLPVISSVASLASLSSNGQPSISQKATTNVVSLNNATITNPTAVASQTQVIFKQQVITRPTSPIQIHNKMTQCKPLMHTKGVSVKPHPCTKSTQTDEVQKVLIPIPVPIYVPFPVHMFSFPFPVPMPFPLPIPVPIFIPTTKNSAKGILKDLKRIQEKLPSDPFEAELLMMAEMVATEKKTDSDSDDSDNDQEPENEHEEEKPENSDSGNAFGEDMLQMALNMASGDLEEPAVDLEAALTSNTITATPAPDTDENDKNETVPRGRKRMVACKSKSVPNKKSKRSSSAGEPLMPPPEAQSMQAKIIEPLEKPDANMALKYTFGVNAWRQWVISKNTELEKQITATKKVKMFKTDLLQLTAEELNYSLCLFVKEVCKPNGSEYAPDTIYYLCLGIQQYLFENNRIDNIFTDSYYEKFTDCLNDVATKFSVLYNDAQYIVTRVEEEHLWECKQLGAHSPHVLLSTLMFFNTKHFNLVTVEEHMQLSFSHIMKHWKRNPAIPGGPKMPGSRNVLLRFYPPLSALEGNSRKKKVYEQQENEDNPLRCPVKLYEFYLSKCPESVKTRNDVFYLLPERSCVPDSPVWYSTSPLAKENLVKMLNRVKMVKEINVALLGS